MKPKNTTALLLTLLLMAVTLSGCASEETDTDTEEVMDVQVDDTEGGSVDDTGSFHLRDVSQGGSALAKQISDAERQIYVLDTQVGLEALEPAHLMFEGTAALSDCGYENPQDAGGTQYGITPLGQFSIADSVPRGQPVEVYSKLVFNPDVGNQADLDLWVSFPGITNGDSIYDDGGWNSASYTFEKRQDITVGAEEMLVGVECSEEIGGVHGQSIDYEIHVDLFFETNALTPFHTTTFTVPEETTHLAFASKPAEGSEPVKVQFILQDPDGNNLWFDEQLNDTADRIYVPIKKAGDYVFYAHSMKNGFLTVTSDFPLPDEVRTAKVAEPVFIDHAMSETMSAESSERAPLHVEAIWGEQSVNVLTTVTITSEQGQVLFTERVARLDQGSDSVGVSGDRDHTVYAPQYLIAGAYQIEVTGDEAALSGLVCREVYAA